MSVPQKRGDKLNKRKWVIIFSAFLAVIIALLIVLYITCQEPTSGNAINIIPATPNDEATPQESVGTISIPGFEKLKFRAGTDKQTLKLYNPPENTCYFLISIFLPDGTQIYQSNLLAPGEEINQIHLKVDVSTGVYEGATLVYSCFSVDTLQPLNGASIQFTLEVI